MSGTRRMAAVIFPGMGYHTDKPLLYYGKKLAKQHGYEIIEVPYRDLKKESNKLEAAFQSALAQTEELLGGKGLQEYGELLFISKSIGTVVASAYAEKYSLFPRHILYTPVEETFSFVPTRGIAFHGTADPMADTEMIRKACLECHIPLFITKCGNHSLETGEALQDLKILRTVMEQTERYIETGEAAGFM